MTEINCQHIAFLLYHSHVLYWWDYRALAISHTHTRREREREMLIVSKTETLNCFTLFHFVAMFSRLKYELCPFCHFPGITHLSDIIFSSQ